MKLSKEELTEIAEIDARLRDWAIYDVGTFVNDCEYLRDLVDKLRPGDKCSACRGTGKLPCGTTSLGVKMIG